MNSKQPPIPRASIEPWDVAEEDFPRDGTDAEKLAFLIRYAVLAPSSHNSQPWLFRLQNSELQLHSDRSRALPVVDPDDRELVISCGAALFHLRVALRHFGFFGEIWTIPPLERSGALALRTVPDLLARVRLGEPHSPDESDERLFAAIRRRHTNRRPFESRPVPERLLSACREDAATEGAWLVLIEGEEKRAALADLVAQADREQWANPSFRRELSAWLHPNRTRSRDGLPGYAFGMGDLESLAGPLVVRTFDRGDGQAARDRELTTGSPALAVVGTNRDDPSAWLEAGQALDRVLLRCTAEGVSTSYLNQPLEVPHLRPRVAEVAGRSGGHPQVILRLGFGPAASPTPRRSADDVLVRGRSEPD